MTAAGESQGKLDRRVWLKIAVQTVLIAVVYTVARELVDREGVVVTFAVSAVSAFLVFSGYDLVKKLLAARSAQR